MNMIILVLVLYGLCLGSFVNALVWRMHAKGQTKSVKRLKQLSISRGRSLCPSCDHQLRFWDLIPVVSWLALRGRCRYCHQAISRQYPLVEVLTAGLFVFSYVFWPNGWAAIGIFHFAVWLAVLTTFMALAVYDYRWQLLPSRLVYIAGGLALAGVIGSAIWQGDWLVLSGAALGVAVLAGLFWGIFQVSDGQWIGGGDVRLAVVIGLLVGGPLQVVLVLFIASLLGILTTLPGLISKKDGLKARIAFGPFLIAATIIVYLFGTAMVTWYKQRFLLL